MRIVCQKCSAAYAIDDKFVTAKGVRAQCPRCRHLQLVKKDDPQAAAAAPAPAPPPLPAAPARSPAPPPAGGELHFGQAPVPSAVSPATAAPAPFAFDFGAPPPPPPPAAGFDFGSLKPPPPAPAATNGGFDFAGLQAPPPPPAAPQPPVGFDFSALAPPGPAPVPVPVAGPNPVTAAQAAAMLDFADDLPPPPPPPARSAKPAPAPPAAPAAPPMPVAPPRAPDPGPDLSAFAVDEQPSQARCKTCGKVLTDAFDQALGTCDDCRSKEHSPLPTGPDSQANLVEHVAATAIHARGGQPAAAAAPTAAAPFASLSSGPPPPSPADLQAVKSAMRVQEPVSHLGRNLAIAAGVVALLLVGGALAYKRPWAKRPPPLVVRTNQTSPNAPQKPVEGIIQQWRLNYPELQGASAKESKAHVDQGDELLRKDTTRAYLDAEEEFQKALVLDPSAERAVAGWALSIAFGRGAQIDDQTAKAAESMLQAAEARGGDPRVYVAHSHLMIARGGNLNDIKLLAERGKNSPDPADKALAALALGQTFLTKNPQLADSSFRESQALDPKLKRTYFFQAQLFASQGKFKDAVDTLERRLQLDKDQWEAAEELARLYVDVGEPAKAKKVLEAAKAASPSAGRPRLDLAILSYQHLGEPAAALEQLTALVNDQELPKPERADAWVHLAVLHRLGGDLQKALDDLGNALEVTPDSVPARLQKFFVLVERGVTSSARLELEGLKDKLNDKALEGVLEGRLLMSENRLDDAIKTLSGVYQADPRRVDALLLAGAAAAKARKDGKAWEFCLKKGLKADPFTRPVPSLTHLYVRPADLLKPAVGAFEALSPKSEEDPNPSLCEGMVAWFAEDLTQAEKSFARVNVIDGRNAEAYAYRTFIALQRHDLGGAARLGARGYDSSKTNAYVDLAQGLVAMQSGRPETAKTMGLASTKLNPSLSSARTLMGEADAKLKDEDEARKTLTTVLLNDPLYREAKRVLYKYAL